MAAAIKSAIPNAKVEAAGATSAADGPKALEDRDLVIAAGAAGAMLLPAKTLNPNLTVVTRAAEEESEQKLRRAGADTVFAPYSITGHRLAQAILRPHVAQLKRRRYR